MSYRVTIKYFSAKPEFIKTFSGKQSAFDYAKEAMREWCSEEQDFSSFEISWSTSYKGNYFRHIKRWTRISVDSFEWIPHPESKQLVGVKI